MKKEEKICVGCENNVNLHKLQNGKYICQDCLDKVGKEQVKIYHDIVSMFVNKYDIHNPENMIKTLESIVINMKYDLNMLSQKEKDELIKIAKQLNNEVIE